MEPAKNTRKKEKYSLLMHDSRFQTEEMCLDYLCEQRWNGKPACRKCGNDEMNYYLINRRVWKCKKCKHQFSAKTGTIFEKSPVPLLIWFKCIYFITSSKQALSSIQMSEWLGVEQKTAWHMMHRIREGTQQEDGMILEGIIEIDETSISPKINRNKRLMVQASKHKKKMEEIHGLSQYRSQKITGNKKVGRPKGLTKEIMAENKKKKAELGERHPFERKKVVLGMFQRDGNIVFKTLGKSIKDITKDNIYPIMKKFIHKSSTVVSDEHSVYSEVDTMFDEHQTVNHSKGYVINGITTNSIECAWRQLKSVLDTYRHTSMKHLEKYLNMQAFRYNRREESKKVLFDDIMPMLFGKRLTYKSLTGQEQDDKIAA